MIKSIIAAFTAFIATYVVAIDLEAGGEDECYECWDDCDANFDFTKY